MFLIELRTIYAYFLNRSPGIVGLGDCESLFARIKNKKITTEKFSVRHFLATQQALGAQELDNVYWLPGLGNPAGGPTKTNSDEVPLLRLWEPGARNPGTLPPLKGSPSRGR